MFSADKFFIKHLSDVPWEAFSSDPLPHEESKSVQGWLDIGPGAVSFGTGYRAYTGVQDRAGPLEKVGVCGTDF